MNKNQGTGALKHWFMIPGWSKQSTTSSLNSLSTLPIQVYLPVYVHTTYIEHIVSQRE